MTHKCFWENPYQTSLDTHITSVQGNAVTVAATICYALSGGQESDQGSIGGHTILLAHKDGAEIVYTLDGPHSLNPGDSVHMTIDWRRRYALMRLHFAAELVLETTYRRLAGIEKIGAHIAQDKARIDFRWHEPLTPVLPLVASDVRALVEANHTITSAFSDTANERRYWEIVGFARVPCGGTHLRSTGEVGALALRRKNVGGGKERIEITLVAAPQEGP